MEAEFDVLEQLGREMIFPDNYIVTDLETSGYSFDNDFIVDIGWCVVRNGEIKHQEGLLLNWALCPGVDHGYVRWRLQKQAEDYRRQGKPHYYSWERLCAEGLDPIDALHAYVTLLWEHINRNELIVGHGLFRFDRKMIDSHCKRFLAGYELPWRQQSIIDTGLIEKAAQTGNGPWMGESLTEWQTRVNNRNLKGVMWNLESHCVPKYDLARRFNLDMNLMHTATFDCVLIHHLLTTFRQLAQVLNGKEDGQVQDFYQRGIAEREARPYQGPQGLR